jgi:hypothetical protein
VPPRCAGRANPTPSSPTPVIQINGDNPARINVGDSYADLGATITSPQADLNLGIKTFLNGQLTSNIVIDTTQAATDTIDYVATDQSGLSSTSTRTIIIQAPPLAPAPSDAASTTAPSHNGAFMHDGATSTLTLWKVDRTTERSPHQEETLSHLRPAFPPPLRAACFSLTFRRITFGGTAVRPRPKVRS